jgi:hypothetical protein
MGPLDPSRPNGPVEANGSGEGAEKSIGRRDGQRSVKRKTYKHKHTKGKTNPLNKNKKSVLKEKTKKRKNEKTKKEKRKKIKKKKKKKKKRKKKKRKKEKEKCGSRMDRYTKRIPILARARRTRSLVRT